MTREEAINRLIEAKKGLTDEVIDIAIKALGQEPCEDAISRQAALDAIDRWCMGEGDEGIYTIVENLPFVTPQPKTGHWIDTGEPNEIWDERYICSECKSDVVGSANYCPTCGARMESEDKE